MGLTKTGFLGGLWTRQGNSSRRAKDSSSFRPLVLIGSQQQYTYYCVSVVATELDQAIVDHRVAMLKQVVNQLLVESFLTAHMVLALQCRFLDALTSQLLVY